MQEQIYHEDARGFQEALELYRHCTHQRAAIRPVDDAREADYDVALIATDIAMRGLMTVPARSAGDVAEKLGVLAEEFPGGAVPVEWVELMARELKGLIPPIGSVG